MLFPELYAIENKLQQATPETAYLDEFGQWIAVADQQLEYQRRRHLLELECVGCAAQRQARLYHGYYVHWYRDGGGYIPCYADWLRKQCNFSLFC